MSDIGIAVCEILGIDPARCRRLTLQLDPDMTAVIAELTVLPLTVVNEVEIAMTTRKWEIREIDHDSA